MNEYPIDLSEEYLEETDYSLKEMRKDLILYLLHKYGGLKTKDIARIIGLSARATRRNLRQLEDSGEIRSIKIGRSYLWNANEEESHGKMYF